MGDAVMGLPAEPEQEHQREGEGSRHAALAGRAPRGKVEQDAGGRDQRIAQNEIRQRAGAGELLHPPQQPFIERRIPELITAGEMALQDLRLQRVLQRAAGRNNPEHDGERQREDQPKGHDAARREPVLDLQPAHDASPTVVLFAACRPRRGQAMKIGSACL